MEPNVKLSVPLTQSQLPPNDALRVEWWNSTPRFALLGERESANILINNNSFSLFKLESNSRPSRLQSHACDTAPRRPQLFCSISYITVNFQLNPLSSFCVKIKQTFRLIILK